MILKQNTAELLPCLLYDKNDFKTPETSVGHASITVWLRKHNGTQYPCAMGTAGKEASFQSVATGGSTTTLVDSKLAGKYADDFFNGLLIRTISGTGANQNLVITDYTGSTGTFTFATATAPDSATVYRVCKGVVDSAGSNYIVDSILTEADDYWNGYQIQIVAGTGIGQARAISDFDSAADKIIVSSNWSTQPDATSVYSLCNRWTERGKGVYDISLGAAEIDTIGSLVYTVTDGQAEYLDFNGLASIETATNTDMKSDTASIKTTAEALPSATEIDAQLSSAHGAGVWGGAGGSGQYQATINVKAGGVNVANAKVTAHNAANDDTPFFGALMTDINGNATFTVDGNLYIRVSKAGYNFTATAINVTASGTYNVTGNGATITPPADPDLCRLYIFPTTLSGGDVTGLTINISSKEDLTKINGEFVKNTTMTFAYDASTTPDSYYFDAVQGVSATITCDELGIDHEIVVPMEEMKDVGELVS